MWIFAGEFPEEGTSNDSGVIENVDLQCFRTLNRRNLRKLGQYYYRNIMQIVLVLTQKCWFVIPF